MEEIATRLNPNKTYGIDEIPTKFIKTAKCIPSPYLAVIFTQYLKTGKYPD